MLKNTFLMVIFLIIISHAQTIINVGIGPSWPAELKETNKKTVWNGTIEYGKVFDNIIVIGVDVDFSWRINDEYDTVVVDSVETYIPIADDKIFMFPISAVLFVDPIPKYRLHPVIRAQFGLNMMARSNEDVRLDGFYIGIIGKGGADAVFDIGDHAAIYGGFEYQWGRLKHKVDEGPSEGSYTKFKFNAPMIRMGISVLF